MMLSSRLAIGVGVRGSVEDGPPGWGLGGGGGDNPGRDLRGCYTRLHV